MWWSKAKNKPFKDKQIQTPPGAIPAGFFVQFDTIILLALWVYWLYVLGW
jgi:hypothetical protein